MSLTLGEKLRQAREERGITLSEVAEQTRISPIYLQSIDNDDYRGLPGGIFNRGFVKSYAKFVGLDEQEALLDYSRIQNEIDSAPREEFKSYKPEVLTDDRSASSMMPTIITAAVILALMTGGILFLVSYLRRPAEPAANTTTRPPSNSEVATNTNTAPVSSSVPDMGTLKVEFKALTEPVSLSATSDGKASTNVVAAGSTVSFEPKEGLKLSYSKSLARNVQLTINGKTITLPAVPLNPKRAAIEFEINKGNLAQIWTSGAISNDVPAANPDVNAETSTPTNQASPTKPTTVSKPTPQANTAQTPAKPAETPKTTPKSATTPKPAVNRPQ